MTDVIIIGGGIAGLSVAAHLAGAADVVLLEREKILASHASGRSAAMFLEGYGNAAVRVLNTASKSGLHAAGVLSPRGVLMLGHAGQERKLAAEATEMGLVPFPVPDAQKRFPILDPARVTCAAWQEEALSLDTDALCQHYAREARHGGARIKTGQEVLRIARQSGVWRVETNRGVFEAPVLVNAAGGWVDSVAALAGVASPGFQVLRRSMAQLPAPGARDVTDWPFVLAAGDAWYAKPEGGRLIVSPSEEDPVEPHDAYAEDIVIAEGLARYEAMVTEPVTRVETTWAGLRTMSPDRALMLGPDPVEPEFIWCAGQGGYGFQTAPAAGRLVAI